MAVKFNSSGTNDGFDDKATPNSLVVPLSGSKDINVTDASGLSIASLNPGIAYFSEKTSSASGTTRMLTITGKMKGHTFIEIRDAQKRLQARLEVFVKTLKKIGVAFNYVEDSAKHKTVRAKAEADTFIKEMNEIYLPQANIQFVKESAGDVKINKDLGSVVRFSAHLKGVPKKEHEWDTVVAKGNKKAKFNIFFVWEYEQDNTPNKDNAGGASIAGNCLFEDNVSGNASRNLAHEMGHLLGCDDIYDAAKKDLLMYGYEDGGTKISKALANIMNP